MSDRCIVRIKFTPAGNGGEVRRAVGGFLRYVQHRDLHPDSKPPSPTPEVAGLLKYVAYRDRVNNRAELFGPQGAIGTKRRKEFADFVARSLEGSRPQLFRTRDGRLVDRRRAVSRLVLSPERAQGLDLDSLTRAAVRGLESETGVTGLNWIAAIHRNTRHHHVHLVLAGMWQDAHGSYRQVDVNKPRLAAMKQAVALEIERQRGERAPSRPAMPTASVAKGGETLLPALKASAASPVFIRIPPLAPSGRVRVAPTNQPGERWRPSTGSSSLLVLRAAARRYQRQMQRDAEEQARQLRWERAA